jgi:hypothetical protein
MILELVVVLVIFVSTVLIFRYTTGFYPASTLIIEDPPVEHNGLEPSQARFMFFYTTWCPWSRKAQAPWRSFKQDTTNKKSQYGDYEILFEEIDAESDQGKTALYKIKEFPSFRLEIHNKVYTFKGVPDPLTFDAFLVSALGNKKTT